MTLNPDNVLAPSSGGHLCVTSVSHSVRSSTTLYWIKTSETGTEIRNRDESSCSQVLNCSITSSLIALMFITNATEWYGFFPPLHTQLMRHSRGMWSGQQAPHSGWQRSGGPGCLAGGEGTWQRWWRTDDRREMLWTTVNTFTVWDLFHSVVNTFYCKISQDNVYRPM